MSGNNGTLQLFDISDRTKLIPKGSYGTNIYFTTKIEMVGDRLYLGKPNKLEILNIADLSNPQKIGEWPEQVLGLFYISDIVAFPDVVWASVANGGTTILDVRNAAAPVEVKTLPGIGFLCHARRGDDLFAGEYLDLKTYDVTDPLNPQLKGISSLGAYYSHISVTNNLAFVSGTHGSSRILDVSNPAKPAPRGPELPAGYTTLIADNKLFLVDELDGINVYDLANPAAPNFLSRFEPGEIGASMTAEGKRLFIAGTNAVKVINFSDPSALKLEKEIEVPPHSLTLARAGNRLVVSSHYVSSYLSVIDITDPANATLMVTFTNAPFVGYVPGKGNVGYVQRNGGIEVYDFTDATNPRLVTNVDLNLQFPAEFATAGDYLLIFRGGPVMVFDVSDPLSPKEVGSIEGMPANSSSVTIAGDVAYVAAGVDGLITIQLAGEPPTQPYLDIINEGEMHRVRWTKDFTGYSLLAAPSLSGPWEALPIDLNQGGLFYEMIFGNGPGMRFYRLAK
jgi:hypothetical protein